jgi:hypothetical protein
MKGIKTVAANLANRINQQHHIETVLKMVYEQGKKDAQIEIDSKKETFTPPPKKSVKWFRVRKESDLPACLLTYKSKDECE